MERSQISYCQQRVCQAFNVKVEELRAKFSKKVRINDQKKMKEIKYNNVSLLRTATCKTPLGQAFDFSDCDDEYELDEPKFNKAQAKLRAEMNQVLDLVNLGTDDKKIVAAVNKFCKGT